jgi:hypothetical protein
MGYWLIPMLKKVRFVPPTTYCLEEKKKRNKKGMKKCQDYK